MRRNAAAVRRAFEPSVIAAIDRDGSPRHELRFLGWWIFGGRASAIAQRAALHVQTVLTNAHQGPPI
jgi:hypothetical protein